MLQKYEHMPLDLLFIYFLTQKKKFWLFLEGKSTITKLKDDNSRCL